MTSRIGEPTVLGRACLALGDGKETRVRDRRCFSQGSQPSSQSCREGAARLSPDRYSCAGLSLILMISPVTHSPFRGSRTHTAARDRVPLPPQVRWGHPQHCTTTQELCPLLPSLPSCLCHPKCSSCMRALHPCTLYLPHPPLPITMASPSGLSPACSFCLWFSSVQGSVPCSLTRLQGLLPGELEGSPSPATSEASIGGPGTCFPPAFTLGLVMLCQEVPSRPHPPLECHFPNGR